MAMAAVRFSARRFTGEQPQAIFRSAVANEQGVLNRVGSPAYARRFTSSDAAPANGNGQKNQHRGVACDERKHFFSRLTALDQKEEELFDLLVEIQRNKKFSESSFIRRKQDRRLLQRLTVHVDPRPTNPEWCRYLGEHIVNICLGGTTSLFAFLYMTKKWSVFFDGNKQIQGADDSNSKDTVSCAEPNIEE